MGRHRIVFFSRREARGMLTGSQMLEALNDLSEGKQRETTFNISTGQEISVNTLAAILLEAVDADCPLVHQPGRPGEQTRSVIDPRKAEHVPGWNSLTPLPDGLIHTLAYPGLVLLSVQG